MDGNLFAMRTPGGVGEVFETLLERSGLRLERIESHGEATPAGDWYDQADDEWVVLLCGAAGLRFEDDAAVRTLAPGDYVFIPRHRRHRVEWTSSAEPTVWLALHLAPAG